VSKKLFDKYIYRVEWSEEDQLHLGRCAEFPSLIAHGQTPQEALKEIRFVVAESIKILKKDREKIPEPLNLRRYKGNLTLRVPPEIHRRLAIKSAEEGVSINQYLLSKISG